MASPLLSGLLKCDECGGNFVVCSSTSYGCTSDLNGGKSACANGHQLPRKRTEKYILGLVRNELPTPEACDLFAVDMEDAEERLEDAQASLDQALLVDETALKGIVAALPRAIGQYRMALDRVEDALPTRLEHSRELLRDLPGEMSLRPNDHALEARMRLDWLSTLNQCEAPETAKLKVMMVAEEG